MSKTTVAIRDATINDAPDIAALSRQLGYTASTSEIINRLQSMLDSEDHAVYVASAAMGRIVGWIHVCKSQRLESASFAEIDGLIVSEAFRREKIGEMLVQAAEEWARHKKLSRLRVRSRLEREDAAKFYLKVGFSVSKQQRVFDKDIHQPRRD